MLLRLGSADHTGESSPSPYESDADRGDIQAEIPKEVVRTYSSSGWVAKG